MPINIGEKIYADVWGESPEKGKVTITAEFFNSEKQQIDYKQVVTEYDGDDEPWKYRGNSNKSG